jgi:hypothetical protein
MATKNRKTPHFLHCFKRKDWNHNRKLAGLSTGKKERERLLCEPCKQYHLCFGV